MRLFIAEKPELAKAITTGLSGTVQREDGYFKVGDNQIGRASCRERVSRTV